MRICALLCGLLFLAAVVFSGCSDNSNSMNGTGTVRMLISDAPLHLDGLTVTEVNVTITKIQLIPGDDEAGAVTVFEGQQPVNLLTLANKPLSQLLALPQAVISAGAYTQLRLIVDDAACNVKVDGVVEPQPLKVASGAQSGLKIPVNLTVAPSAVQVVLVDFDLSKLHAPNNGQGVGEFQLTPNALRVVKLSNTGSITGMLTLPAETTLTQDLAVTLELKPSESADPIVTTQVVFPQDGSVTQVPFTFNGVPAGTYLISATPDISGKSPQTLFPTVVVSTGGTTALDPGIIPAEWLAP